MMAGIIHLLTNDTLSIFDNLVLWVNLIGSLVAIYFNIKSFRQGIPRFRKTGLLVSGLALLFAVGFLHLLLLEPDYMVWAAAYRGIAMVTWPIVWIWPAYLSTQVWGELERSIKEHNEE